MNDQKTINQTLKIPNKEKKPKRYTSQIKRRVIVSQIQYSKGKLLFL